LPLKRKNREIHYPLDVLDPYVLLVHQGMIEDVLLEDLKSRGVEVTRGSPFTECNGLSSYGIVDSTYKETATEQTKTIQSKYLVGCDGAHSKVRKRLGVTMDGESGKAAWGVLDGK
jgi:2-polyprenyl-6-methoxyphenol hydroxylase-like FAD-dependent oxidoreductase